MRKRKILQFSKFILEKYKDELEDEETNVSNKKLEDEFDAIINSNDDEVEIEDDENDDKNDENENIDKLIKEYKMLEKKYKLKSNDRIYKKGK